MANKWEELLKRGIVGTGRSARHLGANSAKPFSRFAVSPTARSLGVIVTTSPEDMAAARRVGRVPVPGAQDVRESRPARARFPGGFSTGTMTNPYLTTLRGEPKTTTRSVMGVDVPVSFEMRKRLTTGPISERRKAERELASVARGITDRSRREAEAKRVKGEREHVLDVIEKQTARSLGVEEAKTARERVRGLSREQVQTLKNEALAGAADAKVRVAEIQGLNDIQKQELQSQYDAAEAALEAGTARQEDYLTHERSLNDKIAVLTNAVAVAEAAKEVGRANQLAVELGELQRQRRLIQGMTRQMFGEGVEAPTIPQPTDVSAESQIGEPEALQAGLGPQEAQFAAAQAYNKGGSEEAQAAWEANGGQGVWPPLQGEMDLDGDGDGPEGEEYNQIVTMLEDRADILTPTKKKRLAIRQHELEESLGFA